MMTRLILLFQIGVFLAASGRILAAARWHVPNADYRIQCTFNGRRKPSLFIRMPLEFQDWKGVVCHAANGKVFCRPVRVGNKLVAVEVTSPRPTSQTVYLYPSEKGSAGTPTGKDLLPIACYYASGKFVARPSDGPGMRQCLLNHAPLVFYKCLPGIPVKTYGLHLFYKLQDDARASHQRAHTMKIRTRLSTNFVVRDASRFQFNLDNGGSGPWYLFIDGKPVFSWGNCNVGNDLRPVSGMLDLKPGIHKLDLFAFPGYGEQFPELRVRVGDTGVFGKLPVDMTYSSLECKQYRVDHRTSSAICNFKLTPEKHTYFRESKTYHLRHNLVDVTPGGNVAYTYEDRPLAFKAGFAIMNLSSEPTILTATLGKAKPLKKLRFPVVGDAFVCNERIIRLRVTDMPFFEPVEKPLVLRYGVTVDNGIGPPPPHSSLEVLTVHSGDAPPNRETMPVPYFPNKRSYILKDRDVTISQLDLRLLVDGTPASNTVRIYFLPPRAKLSFEDNGGRFLHHKDGLAILRRQTGALKPDTVAWNGSVDTIGLVDGFIANGIHPYETYSFDDFDWGGNTVVHLPVKTDRDNHFLTDKFRRLDALKTDTVDMLLFSPSLAELKALDLRDLREQTLYLLRVVRGSGKQIGFVSPPAIKELEPRKLRSYVLTLKELGRTFRFPVVDLYSSSRGLKDIDKYWDWREPEATPIRTAVPNAKGQRWIYGEIKKVIGNKKWQ